MPTVVKKKGAGFQGPPDTKVTSLKRTREIGNRNTWLVKANDQNNTGSLEHTATQQFL